MAEIKTRPTGASVAKFLGDVADEQRRADAKKLAKLLRTATGETARMWGDAIVGYGTYTLRYASGKTLDWPLLAFSPRKQSLTLYVTGLRKYKDLLAKLGPHKASGVCLHLKRLADVDEKVLVTLAKRSFTEERKKAKG
ncbi:MAG: DUF1801 domain-containing protein [Candidatus Eisenbacteria bacterium]